VNHWVVRHVRRPLTLLCARVLSAVLVNDTACLVMTPLALDMVLQLRRDPTPYLLAIAMASNIGSVATITGNPQNMIVGSVSQIPYGTFATMLMPVAIAGLALLLAFLALAYRAEFFTADRFDDGGSPPRYHGRLVSWPFQ
jgi:Na+/H+ antiporter NhaD/arsenite permease-like protein